jgi:CDP-glycerol glycerophosphotransferase (TagB/SpsB family)
MILWKYFKFNKQIMKHFFSIIAFILSYIIPKKNNLYIFHWMRWNFFSWNSKAMFLFILKNKKDIKPLYYINNQKIINYLLSKEPSLQDNIIKWNTIKGFFNLFRAKYIFIDEHISSLSYPNNLIWNFNIINLWHGDWIKDIRNVAKNLKTKFYFQFVKWLFNKVYKFIITWSENIQKIFIEAFPLINKVYITWLPRNDVFFRNDLEIFNVPEKFNLKKYNKVILYAPTHRSFWEVIKPFSDIFLEKLNLFLKEQNYIFLINKHRSAKKIITWNYSNIKDISDEIFDIQELLKYTDIMITDYSSIFVDFLLLDKPIIFYQYDKDEYIKWAWWLINWDNNKIITRWFCQTEKELFNFIKSYFKDSLYWKEYKDIKKYFHKYQDWWYCDKVLKLIK